MMKHLLLAAALLSSTPVMAEEVLFDQRGIGTWGFTASRDTDGFVTCLAGTESTDRKAVLSYFTIGSDVMEVLAYSDPILAFGEPHDFGLILLWKDGTFDMVEHLEFRPLHEEAIYVDMTEDLYARLRKAERFAVMIDGMVIDEGWVYPEALQAVRACHSTAAIMEGMGLTAEGL